MSSNKKAKERLIELYGAECFIEKLGFRKFDKPVHYTSKGQRKRMEMLTYHHIQMKKDGGKATVENGALLRTDNHAWFHQQSKEAQRIMNQAFQDYKKNYKKCDVEIVEDVSQPYELELIELEVTDKEIKTRKFNRSEIKKETKELIDEYYQER
jgi:hypothetical protein